jgi:putative cell wall-binding protein
MRFTVELEAISGQEVTVDFTTEDGDSAPAATIADGDYEKTTDTVEFPPGSALRTITVPVKGDTKPEENETFRVVLSNPTGTQIADGTGVGTIIDDDAPPTIEAGANRSVETAVSRAYQATVSGPEGIPLTVTWDFGDGTDPKVGNPVTHRFGAVGTFTVTATVSNGKGGEASDSFEVEAFDTGAIGRLWGDSRITTAIRTSEANWPTSQHALIALADKYPDALAAGPLSAKLDAPLLLSGPSAMSAELERELHRLRAKTVWLLGGEGSLSAAIEQRLKFLGYAVERRSGGNRFDTAAAIAREVGPNSAREVVLTLGEHADQNRAFPDALSAGSLSASPQRLPLLLTRTDDLPATTEQALSDLGTKKVWIVGGSGSVSSAVETRLRALGYEVQRLAGSGRYATSVAVAEEAMKRTAPGQVRVVFATGEKFPDGLTGGALAARVNGVLLLVPNGTLDPVTQTFVADDADRFDVGVILGGSGTLGEDVRLGLATLMKS